MKKRTKKRKRRKKKKARKSSIPARAEVHGRTGIAYHPSPTGMNYRRLSSSAESASGGEGV
jgi:hypothetical protein